jgi:hypothetical protein
MRKWNRRSAGKNRIWTSVHRTWTSLRHLDWSFEESGQGLDEQKSQKTLGIHNWTQTGKGIYTRIRKDLLKLNRDQLRWMVGLFKGHSHLKGHLFKLGLTDDPTCERCLEEVESATLILYDCEAIAYLRFRHLGQFFMELSDYYDSLINRVLHFIRSVGLLKSETKGKHNRSLTVVVQGPDY